MMIREKSNYLQHVTAHVQQGRIMVATHEMLDLCGRSHGLQVVRHGDDREQKHQQNKQRNRCTPR